MAPKILHIDIETAPTTIYCWNPKPNWVSPDKIVKDGYTLCFAAKWHGQKKIVFKSAHHDGHEATTKAAWELLDEADAVVHYNGTRFDIKHLNKDFMLARLGPPSSYQQMDLFRTAKKFALFSLKLDEIAKQLDLDGKLQHKGMALWHGCMNDNEADWRTMRRYNTRDVILLEDVYQEFLPWIDGHINYGLFSDHDGPVCTHCGGTDLEKRGYRYTKTQKYQRYYCRDCNSWSADRNTAVPADKRPHVLNPL